MALIAEDSPQKKQTLPLAQVMKITAQHLTGVLSGNSLTLLLDETPANARAVVQAHDFYALRQLGWAQTVCGYLVRKKPKKLLLYAHLLHSLILLEAASRWGGHSGKTRKPGVPLYTIPTIVDQAVQAATLLRLRFHKRFINGVLRRFLRERPALLKRAAKEPLAVWNFPVWWLELLQSAYPEQWRTIALNLNAPASLTLRVNTRRCSVNNYLNTLKKAGIAAYHSGAETVVLEKTMPVVQLPGYAEGLLSIQDSHAQLAGHLLPVQKGDYILDACTAPGGKAAHLLERYDDIKLVALDIDANRLTRVKENLQRLGLLSPCVYLQEGNATQPQQWWSGRLFDAILADVPCTASGVVRRRPDVRWLRRKEDVAATAQLQAEICDALWPLLKPQGYFLYVTCSVFPIEGEQQITRFLSRQRDAVRLTAPGQLLPTPESSEASGGDGFYYALLQKEA